jgi:hypothetical protein
MDRFRMVRPAAVALALLYGGASAAAAAWAHQTLLEAGLSSAIVTRYIAPAVEEAAKALLLMVLVSRGRVGFLVEAAVQGFAIGTGFAAVENLSYLQTAADLSPIVWVVRGFGTAVLHGATTAILAMLARTLADRRPERLASAFLPGWLAAFLIHSAFNHRFLPPMAQTCLVLIALPLLMLVVFGRSERATREWIGAGLDLDIELLHLIESEHADRTRFGNYLRQLRERMPPHIIADMHCLLRVELELAIQAKALLLAREAGVTVPSDSDLERSLAERQYLHRSIGPLGLMALKPLQVTSHRDTWHRHILRQRRSARQKPRTSDGSRASSETTLRR